MFRSLQTSRESDSHRQKVACDKFSLGKRGHETSGGKISPQTEEKVKQARFGGCRKSLGAQA
jgi:hypothetical protein